MAHFMNKQHGKHMGHDEAAPAAEHGEHHAAGAEHKPSIHIHSHAKGHTVHIMHKDGAHEKHEHEHGDTEGIKAHIDEHLGQDHGYSSDGLEEDEFGAGPGV